jgi:hypothetical protein
MLPAREPFLDHILFDGERCVELARGAALPVAVLRRRIAAAIAGAPEAPPRGAEVMLALHAVGALDPDEHDVVELALQACPALRASHDRYRERIAELCTSPLRAEAPSPWVWVRLLRSLDADDAAS